MTTTLASGNTRRYVYGHLPDPGDVGAILAETHALHAHNTDGEVSQVYPALARVDPALFGLSIVGTSGNVYEVGDAQHPFTIMSVSKPFLMALVCMELGWEALRSRVGANATGMAFNSLAAIETSADNSVRGVLAARSLSERLGLDLFVSAPAD